MSCWKVHLERLVYAAQLHGSAEARVRERRREHWAARKTASDTWFWRLGDKVIAMNDAAEELAKAEEDVVRYAERIEQLKAEILEDAMVQQSPDGSGRRLLALDLGTQTGWATAPMDAKACVSGTQSFALGRYDGSGMRYVRFGRWLDEILEGVGHVAFEEVRRHVGTDAAHVFGGLQAFLLARCETAGLPCEAIPVGTWKKHLTGKGNANKELVIERCRALGYAPVDTNEADAIGLWRFVASGGR